LIRAVLTARSGVQHTQPSSSLSIVQLAATASMAALRAVACDRLCRPLTRRPLTRAGSYEEDGPKQVQQMSVRAVICSTRSWKIRHRRSSSWVSTELAADRSAAWLISSAAAYR
jgi:hypothetical protein